MSYITLARKLRSLIEKAAQSLSDADALEGIELYPFWRENESYEVDMRIRYNNILYRVLQAHTSQANWTPDVASSLFAKVLIPDPTIIPDWEQPDSTNPYNKDDKVRHNGQIWISLIDGNIWEPGVYGWEVDE